MRSFLKELNKLLYSFCVKVQGEIHFIQIIVSNWYYRNVHYDNSGLGVK